MLNQLRAESGLVTMSYWSPDRTYCTLFHVFMHLRISTIWSICGLLCFVSWNSGCFILLTASWHLVANPETSQTAAAVCNSCSCRYNVLFKRFLCFTVRNYLLVKWYSSMMLRDSRVSAKLCTYTHYKGNPNSHKCKMSLRLVGTSATTSVWLCRALSVCFIENISVHSQTGEAWTFHSWSL